MTAKKLQKTNAVRMVEQQALHYTEHSYEWSEEDLSAEHVAEQLKRSLDQIFKTLVLRGNVTGVVVAVIPGSAELDLKKLARESGNKKIDMLHVKELEKITGYLRGGCSPIGMKKLFPTYIDETAQIFDTIIISAGRRGLQLEMAPDDIVGISQATLCDITTTKLNKAPSSSDI